MATVPPDYMLKSNLSETRTYRTERISGGAAAVSYLLIVCSALISAFLAVALLVVLLPAYLADRAAGRAPVILKENRKLTSWG